MSFDSIHFHPEPFFHSRGELINKRERECKEIAQFLRAQFSQELASSSQGRYRVSAFDAETTALFNKILYENVSVCVPRLLSRNFTLDKNDLISRAASFIRPLLVQQIPQFSSFSDVKPAQVRAEYRTENEDLSSGEEVAFTRLDAQREPPSFGFPMMEEREGWGHPASESTLQDYYDQRIAALREKEIKLCEKINAKKDEIEGFEELLGVPDSPRHSASDSFRDFNLTKRRNQQVLSVEQLKERRIKNMNSYIKKRERELDGLASQSYTLKLRLQEETKEEIASYQDEESGSPDFGGRSPKIRKMENREGEMQGLSAEASVPHEGPAKKRAELPPVLTQMVPRVILLKQLGLQKESGK